jgi:hypothetical protein
MPIQRRYFGLQSPHGFVLDLSFRGELFYLFILTVDVHIFDYVFSNVRLRLLACCSLLCFLADAVENPTRIYIGPDLPGCGVGSSTASYAVVPQHAWQLLRGLLHFVLLHGLHGDPWCGSALGAPRRNARLHL